MSVEQALREEPPRSVKEAGARITALTGIHRGLSQVRQWLRKLGLRYRKVGMVPAKADATNVQYRSVGPGGFIRQGPGDTQAPIPPAPPRRLVPAKPSAEVANKTSLLELNDRICRWPMGHPGEPDFHFCGNDANPGYPYCVDHCGVAYQAQLPRRDRRPPPPLPFGGPRVR